MTSIDAVTITAQFLYSLDSPCGEPAPDSLAFLYTDPGGVTVGRLDAGILSLQQPDGDRQRRPCPDVDEAVREATLTWNTTEGFATLDRWIGVRRALATWTGERRHEWREPKQLVALVKATIRQAVKDGGLPSPNDYRVTWRKSQNTISVITKHAWLRSEQIHKPLETLLRPFNASTAGDFRGCVIERLDFYIRASAPNQPKEDRTLAATEIWA